MAYNGIAEDYLKPKYGEAYKYINEGNVGYYRDVFAKRDLSDPIYVYNELFSDYYKDIISFTSRNDDNHNAFIKYELPLTKYSNAEVSSGVFYSDKNLNDNIKKYSNFNSKIEYDESIEDSKLSELAKNYFSEVKTFADTYYKFRQAYIYAYVNDKIGNDNKSMLNTWKPMLDKMETNLKISFDECIKLSTLLYNRETVVDEIANNPVQDLFGGQNLVTLIKHYSSRTENIDFFENPKNFETEGATLISDNVYRNLEERNNKNAIDMENSLDNLKSKIVNQESYVENTNYKLEVNRYLCELAKTRKDNKEQISTLEVESVSKPKNTNKVKMGIKGKIGLIILGVTALGAGVFGAKNYAENKAIEKHNQEMIEAQVQIYEAQQQQNQEQNCAVKTIYDENTFTMGFNVSENARMFTDGRLQTGGSYIWQSPMNISLVQYPRTIGVARFDNYGNMLDWQAVSDYSTLIQKYNEGYNLYSVLDTNGIAWWNVNDTSLAELNVRTQSYTR